MVDGVQLRTASDQSGDAEHNQEEPARRLQKSMSTADEDAEAKCRRIVNHFQDGNAIRVRYLAHCRCCQDRCE